MTILSRNAVSQIHYNDISIGSIKCGFYHNSERPSGVMFGFLVATDVQPDSYDICKIPATKFLRIRMCDETARALGHEPWAGGIPPYHWIGEQIAPKLGYTYGNDTLPIVEYYGFFKPEDGSHEYCYLYVPMQKNDAVFQ